MPLTPLLVVAVVIGFRHGLGCPEPATVVGLSAEWSALRGAAAVEGHAPPGLIWSADGLRRARV